MLKRLISFIIAMTMLSSCNVNKNDEVKEKPEKNKEQLEEMNPETNEQPVLTETSNGENQDNLDILPKEENKLSNQDDNTNENKSEQNIEEPININQEELENTPKSIDILNINMPNNEITICNSDFLMSDELKNEFKRHITSFGGDCSFLTINLDDGMSFGYNIDKTYPTASTIKAPFALYSFKEMDKGNGNLEEQKLYEERFRRDGSGVLQYEQSGTYYSLKDLFYYTLNYSDNVAYYMVHDRFYSESYNEFLKDLGCNNLYLYDGRKWGQIDARSMAIVWQEIYEYKDESENGKYLFELLTNAEYNYISEGMDKYPSAHKSGWTPNETHDGAIVFAKDNYIVIILTKNNGNYAAKSQLLRISKCIEKGIDEYTLYKDKTKEDVLIKTLKP